MDIDYELIKKSLNWPHSFCMNSGTNIGIVTKVRNLSFSPTKLVYVTKIY